MRPLTIDMHRLEYALDGRDSAEYYLDLESGAIRAVFPSEPAPGVMEKYDVQQDRYLHIEPLESAAMVLVCARKCPWSKRFRKLKKSVPLRVLGDFPLILPEADSDIRRVLDPAVKRKRWTDQMKVVVETGGWLTILSYVSAGYGVGVVSESAIARPNELLIRHLDPRSCPASISSLICRRSVSAVDGLDLNEEARAWRDILKQAARTTPPRRRKN